MLKGAMRRSVERYSRLTCEQLNVKRMVILTAGLDPLETQFLELMLTFPTEIKEFLKGYEFPYP
jgi:hypothetical protein